MFGTGTSDKTKITDDGRDVVSIDGEPDRTKLRTYDYELLMAIKAQTEVLLSIYQLLTAIASQ